LSRIPVHVRDATPADVPALLAIWSESHRRPEERGQGERGQGERCERERGGPPHPSPLESANAVARVAVDPDQRLLVAEYDGRVVAAAHLSRGPRSPLHTEPAVFVTHLHVLEGYRRHGVGRALVEATVSWAEEKSTAHVLVAASVHDRDANRFLARLGLCQVAVWRGASVNALRAKLPVEPPAAARGGSRSPRSVGQVLAQRRSMRRAQAKSGSL
jgi:GNAT superfamily N-acetyltransferase